MSLKKSGFSSEKYRSNQIKSNIIQRQKSLIGISSVLSVAAKSGNKYLIRVQPGSDVKSKVLDVAVKRNDIEM